jgi:site-specific DNA-methyltransferase (adenine-specific)
MGNCLNYTISQGDCLELMKSLPDESIDLILSDLPYGTTYAKWDEIIPAKDLWLAYKRIIKPNGAIVLTASQPFTSMLISSNPEMFRCSWVWNKENAANFANAKKQPLKVHEDIIVFGKGQTTYNPQMIQGKPNHIQGKNAKENKSETRLISKRVDDDLSGLKYPKTILNFPKHSSQCGLHPTQKPVDLMRYLIRTYSNPGELVLDNCMGSGTTGVACIIEKRQFVGFEKEEKYFKIAEKRLQEENNKKNFFRDEDKENT